MKASASRPTFLAGLIAVLAAILPGGSAVAGLSGFGPAWSAPLADELDHDRLRMAKWKFVGSRPDVLTAHTNQPPAPPAPPSDPLLAPPGDRIDRTRNHPVLDPVPIDLGIGLPDLGGHEPIVLDGSLHPAMPGAGDLLGDVIEPASGAPATVGGAMPSVVPGPGGLLLLLGAGLGTGRRRHRRG